MSYLNILYSNVVGILFTPLILLMKYPNQIETFHNLNRSIWVRCFHVDLPSLYSNKNRIEFYLRCSFYSILLFYLLESFPKTVICAYIEPNEDYNKFSYTFIQHFFLTIAPSILWINTKCKTLKHTRQYFCFRGNSNYVNVFSLKNTEKYT